MGYTAHTFTKGEPIYAAPFNEMDQQIQTNTSSIQRITGCEVISDNNWTEGYRYRTSEPENKNPNSDKLEINPQAVSNSAYRCVTVPCKSYEKFTIHVMGGVWYKAYVFTDNSNKVLSFATEYRYYDNEVITAPKGATKLYINDGYNYSDSAGTNIYLGIKGYVIRGVSSPAINQALNKNVSGINSDISQIRQDITNINIKDDYLKHSIDNLEAVSRGQLYTVTTGITPAYQQTVPANVLPYAEISMIGGRMVYWNLISVPSINKSTYCSNIEGCKYQITGELTTTIDRVFKINTNVIAGHVYAVKVVDTNFPYDLESGAMQFNDVFTANNYIFKKGIFVVKATTEGENLVIGVSKSSRLTITYPINVYSMVVDLTEMFGASYANTMTDNSPELKAIEKYAMSHSDYTTGEYISSIVDKVVTSKGTYSLPEALELRSINNTYDSVEQDDNGNWYKHQRIRAVKLSDMAWSNNSSYPYVYQVTAKDDNQYLYSSNFEAICDKYTVTAPVTKKADVTTDKTITCYNKGSSGNSIYIRDESLNGISGDDFKEYLKDHDGMLFYVLNTDKTTRIAFDGLIPVESGDTITFHQTDTELPVPNTINYLCKIATTSYDPISNLRVYTNNSSDLSANDDNYIYSTISLTATCTYTGNKSLNYIWNTPNGTSSGASITVSDSGQYWFTVTDGSNSLTSLVYKIVYIDDSDNSGDIGEIEPM